MTEKGWIKWTISEAASRTFSTTLQKVFGNLNTTLEAAYFATLVIGLIQTIFGYLMTKKQGLKLAGSGKNILGSCAFGLIATVCTILGFSIFQTGGEVGVRTFIITLSIVPGALLDRFFFGHKLNSIGWLGVAVAIFAGYSILEWPTLTEALKLPLWVWLSLLMTVFLAINQAITQWIKDVSAMVKNFWGGLTTLIATFTSLLIIGQMKMVIDFSAPMIKLWSLGTIIGLNVVLLWTLNLYGYKKGAHIAIKKLVMNGSYLTMAMVVGIAFFGEQITTLKGLGIILYPIGFWLMNKDGPRPSK